MSSSTDRAAVQPGVGEPAKRGHRGSRAAAAAAAAGLLLAACGTTHANTPTTSGGGRGAIPTAAFHDTTGVTASTITVGNVSTDIGGLFKGASVGVQAYFDYVNSTGGVDGRNLVLNASDDGYDGATNKTMTASDVQKDFAMVGSFSLQDSFGGQILAQYPQVPDVSETLDPTTGKLPNTFSPAPLAGGWEEGPLMYLKNLYPKAVASVGTLVANQPSSVSQWNFEHGVMSHLGYKVVYDNTFNISQQDFNANVIAMKNDGVKMLFIEQQPALYAVPILKDLQQQNFHPIVVLGASTYSPPLYDGPNKAANLEGAYLEQNAALYLGTDRAAIPAVDNFLTWVDKVDPGFEPDLFTLYGWTSAELFVQALKAAGPDPTRGSVLTALRNIKEFDADHLITPSDPADKTMSNCYVMARFTSGSFQRVGDPPVSGPTHGFRCDYQYYVPPVA